MEAVVELNTPKTASSYAIRTHRCLVCKSLFRGRFSASREYCSRQCTDVGRGLTRRTRARSTRVCIQCSAAFEYLDQPRTVGLVCSTACWNVYQGRNKRPFVCNQCGEAFYLPESTALARERKYKVSYCSLACRDASPEYAAKRANSSKLQRDRQGPNANELRGYALLDSVGASYTTETLFAGKFVADAIVESSRLVVQFDGDYWHDRGGGSTERRIQKRVSNDRSQDAYVRACGWEVIRFWESDLQFESVGCRARLLAVIGRPLGAPPERNPLAPWSSPRAA